MQRKGSRNSLSSKHVPWAIILGSDQSFITLTRSLAAMYSTKVTPAARTTPNTLPSIRPPAKPCGRLLEVLRPGTQPKSHQPHALRQTPSLEHGPQQNWGPHIRRKKPHKMRGPRRPPYPTLQMSFHQVAQIRDTTSQHETPKILMTEYRIPQTPEGSFGNFLPKKHWIQE